MKGARALRRVIATPQAEKFADNPIYAMVVMITAICLPNRFRPNQAEAASPMVCEGARALRRVITTPQAKRLAKAASYQGTRNWLKTRCWFGVNKRNPIGM